MSTDPTSRQWAAWFQQSADEADDLTPGQAEGFRIAAEHLENSEIAGKVARIWFGDEAGTTEPAPDGDSWESITGALVLVGAEQKDTTPGLLALLPIVDRIRALARAGAPAEPTGDTEEGGPDA